MDLKEQIESSVGFEPTDDPDDINYLLWEGEIHGTPLRIYHPPELFLADGATPDLAECIIVVIQTELSFNLRIDPKNLLRNFFQTVTQWFRGKKKIRDIYHGRFLAFSDDESSAKQFVRARAGAIETLLETFHHIEVREEYAAQGKIYFHDDDNFDGLSEVLERFVDVFSSEHNS